MKSARRDRTRLMAKKFRKLIRKTRRTIYFTELLLKKDEKHKESNFKHIFTYDLWTRKKPEELNERLQSLEILITDTEKFIEQYDAKFNAWI